MPTTKSHTGLAGDLGRFLRLAAIPLLAAFLCTPTPAAPPESSGRDVFRTRLALSRDYILDRSPKDALAAAKSLAEFIAEDVSERWKHVEIEVEYAPPLEDLAAKLESGTIGIAYVTPYEYVRLRSRSAVRPIASGSQDRDVSTQRAVLVVRKDCPAKSIADLRGKTFAFLNRNSIASFLYPEWLLCKAGLPPISEYFGKKMQVKKEKSALYAVLLGGADVACVSSSLLEVLTELSPAIGGKIRVLAESESFPKGVLIAGPSLPEEGVGHMMAALCDETRSPERREQLFTFFRVHRFVRVGDGEFDGVRRLVEQIDSRRKQHLDPGCSRWLSDVEATVSEEVAGVPVRFCSEECRNRYLDRRERARPEAERPLHIVGVSPYMMLDRDPRDAREAVELLLDDVRESLDIDAAVEILPSLAMAKARLAEGTLSWAYLSGPGYVRLKREADIIPVVRYSLSESSFRASLVTSEKSGFADLPSLEGKNLALCADEESAARLYLGTIMLGTGQTADEYFASLLNCPSEESAVKAVALGEAEAALVTTRTLGLLKELNPGLYQGLRGIRTSGEFISGPICQRGGLPKELADRFIRYALTLHESPEGLNLLKYFRTTRLLPASDSDYEPIRQMLRALEERR